jgi:hypothetical protein
MRTKKGNLLPKKGNLLHGNNGAGVNYTSAIARTLRRELGTSHQAIKTAMRWTGASERTVKYWFAGTAGPSGQYLIALARHSDEVLRVFLQLAGRHHFTAAIRLIMARDALRDTLRALDKIVDDVESG